MAFVSITRLRLRSAWFMPRFVLHALSSLRQCKQASGFLEGSLLPDRKRTFWTMTLWQDQAAMRAYEDPADRMKARPVGIGVSSVWPGLVSTMWSIVANTWCGEANGRAAASRLSSATLPVRSCGRTRSISTRRVPSPRSATRCRSQIFSKMVLPIAISPP